MSYHGSATPGPRLQSAPVDYGVNVYHALIAGCGDDNEAFAPVLQIKGCLTDNRKEQRLPGKVVNEVRLFYGTTFLSLKPAVCWHDGTAVVPQLH